MAQTLEALQVENLDVSLVRGANRLLTRAMSQWAYAASNDDGVLCYSGIRYGSRLGDYECWAVFAGTQLDELSAQSIEKSNEDLQSTARVFGLTIH
ncbi:hypothetical protein [Subtercola lobariae]|uniref:RES domain-containing protein n=1 Tax=Subtercola lobariae TaxID=1588641 RepID=A0A917EXP5_9MICO|nr:hypothetical protein [Subtercola lobariae]GGF19648.1 hypothetical protein GCM10011399_11570 [Subtercola lobariae]